MAPLTFKSVAWYALNCLILASTVSASATVKHDPNGPTGYEVVFRYRSPPGQPALQNVSLGSGFLFTDPLHTSAGTAASYLPFSWKADYINFGSYADLISGKAPTLDMIFDQASGDWVCTIPLPSGTFQYSFLINCAPPAFSCSGVIDKDNPPIQAALGGQSSSIIQIPFSKKHQKYDYTWQLPLEDVSKKGTYKFMNYTSPGSIYPEKDVHSAGVYLPNGYTTKKKYPIIYFHHGRGGNQADWFNQGRLQNILDRLIEAKAIPPAVIVTPSFYNLGFTPEQYATSVPDYHYSTYDQNGIYAFDSAVRENYFKYLMPWVESTLSVATTPANRTFVGLSMGGGLTNEMLFNATSYFNTYGLMSQVPFTPPVPSCSVAAFQSKKLFFGAGLYDFALPSTLNAQSTFAQVGIKQFTNHFPSCGGHSWSVWQELAYVFLKDVWAKP